ncbi:MAG: TonB-dependent receptor, partial [Saprospiraceae bacterium]|nr:TonB-dependent receptor [Saprospiraceae bacterium]
AQNVATAENKGVELALNYRNYDHPLRFLVGGNITFIDSKVTGLGFGNVPVLTNIVQSSGTSSLEASRTAVGYPVAGFYGYVTDGIFQNQAEVEAAAFQNDQTAPGDIRFKDLDGNGIINESDRTYIGNPTPRFTYGFTTNLDWCGFELNLFFQGTQGNDIYVNTTRYDFSYVNRPSSALGRWTGEGTSTTEPRISLTDPNLNARISDRFIEDGSYLRLKTLQFAYNLPQSWLKKARFDKMKIYVTGQNLLTWTKYSGLDPEIGVVGRNLEIGTDRGFYPQARTVLGGINLTF